MKRLRLFHFRQDRGLTQDWGGLEDRMTAPGWDISKAQSTDVWASGRTGDRGVVLALNGAPGTVLSVGPEYGMGWMWGLQR